MDRRGAAAAAIVLLLGIGWFAMNRSGEPPPPGANPPPPAAPSAAAPVPGAPRAPASGPAKSAGDAADPRPGAGPAVPKGPRWLLRGTLPGFDPALGPVKVAIEPVEETEGESAASEPIVAPSDGTGRFEADITPFFAGGVPVAEIEAVVDARDYLPVRRRVQAATATPGPGGTRVLQAEVPLVRAILVRGRVVDEAGAAVPGAMVGAFPMEGEAPRGQPVDRAEAGPDGAFTVRLGSHDPVLLLAARVGRLPGTAPVEGREGETPVLVLRAGVSISGRVVVGEEPAAGAVVRAEAGECAHELQLGDLSAAWRPGETVLSTQEAVADERGRFLLSGLEPGVYHVRVERVPGPWVFHDARESAEGNLAAPAADVLLRVVVSRLKLSVRAGGKPLASASVTVREKVTTDMTTTDADGLREFLARPGATYRFIVEAAGMEAWEEQVTAPPQGGEAVVAAELIPQRRRPSLVVVLVPPDGKAIDRIAVALAEPGVPVRGLSSTRVVPGTGNRFRVADLEPGRFRVVVRAGGEWLGGTGTWLEAEAEVSIPTEGEIVEEFRLRNGGRLRVVARDREGRPADCSCSVLDGAGRRIPVTFTLREPGGNLTGSTGGPLAGPPCIVDPALPSGRYRLDFSGSAFMDRSVEAEVREGETTDVDVALEPK